MKDVLFLQFVTKGRFHDFYDMGNGFSDTYDLCKSKGDFYLMDYRFLERGSMGKMITDTERWDKFESLELPISKGTIYVSAIYVLHMYQVYVWAKKYPNIKFIVGGPSALSSLYIMTKEMPKNMVIYEGSLEKYFGVPVFSYEWKIDIPPFVTGKDIVMAYTIDNSCYWGKCTYCNHLFYKERRVRKQFDFEFKDIKHDGLKIIRLNSPSLSPSIMKSIFPELPCKDDFRYDVYMKMGKQENDALKEIFPHIDNHNFRFITGLEFPSEEILSRLNKGIIMDDVYDMMETFRHNNHIFQIFLIMFIDDLTEKNVDEMQIFIDKVPRDANISLALTRIFAKPHTVLYDQYKKGTDVNIGPFYIGYIPDLSIEQIKRGREIKNICYQYPDVLDFAKGMLSYDDLGLNT